jgi:protein disulfide-isomerase
MKKIVLLFLLTCAFQVSAQELTWHSDINKAIEISNKEKKPILLFFTGSDWCGWCIKLQKEVFFTDAFKKWAKQHVTLVELDFPRKKQLEPALQQQNAQLKQMFQVRGYPTAFIVTPENVDGKVNLKQLARTGYVAGGPEKWIESVQAAFPKM